jgi:hypothetical protein
VARLGSRALRAQGQLATLAARLPQLAYVAIASFEGAEQAIGILEELKAQEGRSQRPSSRAKSASVSTIARLEP